MTSTATILLPFALLATLYSCSPCFAASVLTQSSSSSSSSSSSLESAVSRRSRRSTPFTYGIISEIVAGPVDICTIRIEDKNYFKTFFLDLSTGKLDGLTGPSKSRICQYEIVRVPMSDDTFVEMSFSKDAGRSEDACFTIEGPGMSETRLEPACRIDGNEKVFFRQKASGIDRRLTISMAEEVLRKNLNAQLMIRHLPDQVQEETLNIIGDLRLKCDHPNELLKPYLFKDGEGDLTLKLEEPEKRVYTAKYDLKGNVQGRYTCSWDEQKSADSIFRVNVFAPTINCSITMDGKDKTPDGKTLGDYLVIYRDSADTSSQLEFGCVLEKATMSGSPDGALGWDASTEEQQPNDFKTDSRADKISASFSRRISELIGNRDLKDVKYTCSVDHSKSKIDFRGGEPKACSIQIIVEETDPNPKSASMIYIGVAIAVVVLIVIVVVLVLWRRRKGTHDTTAGSVEAKQKPRRPNNKKGKENQGVEMT